MPNPVSAIAIATEKLARMVALSETFAAGRTYPEARARVFRKNVIGLESRPFAVISPGEKHAFSLIAGGSQNHLRASGSLFLYLTRDTPEDFYNDSVAAEDDAANWFGLIAEQIAALSAADDPESFDGTSHLSIVSIERVIFDETPEDHWNSLGRFYFAGYSLDWGDGTS